MVRTSSSKVRIPASCASLVSFVLLVSLVLNAVLLTLNIAVGKESYLLVQVAKLNIFASLDTSQATALSAANNLETRKLEDVARASGAREVVHPMEPLRASTHSPTSPATTSSPSERSTSLTTAATLASPAQISDPRRDCGSVGVNWRGQKDNEDLANQPISNLNSSCECHDHCTGNHDCQYWAYNEAKRECWLKKNYNFFYNDPSFTCGWSARPTEAPPKQAPKQAPKKAPAKHAPRIRKQPQPKPLEFQLKPGMTNKAAQVLFIEEPQSDKMKKQIWGSYLVRCAEAAHIVRMSGTEAHCISCDDYKKQYCHSREEHVIVHLKTPCSCTEKIRCAFGPGIHVFDPVDKFAHFGGFEGKTVDDFCPCRKKDYPKLDGVTNYRGCFSLYFAQSRMQLDRTETALRKFGSHSIARLVTHHHSNWNVDPIDMNDIDPSEGLKVGIIGDRTNDTQGSKSLTSYMEQLLPNLTRWHNVKVTLVRGSQPCPGFRPIQEERPEILTRRGNCNANFLKQLDLGIVWDQRISTRPENISEVIDKPPQRLVNALAVGLPVISWGGYPGHHDVLRNATCLPMVDNIDEVGKALQRLVLSDEVRRQCGEEAVSIANSYSGSSIGKLYVDAVKVLNNSNKEPVNLKVWNTSSTLRAFKDDNEVSIINAITDLRDAENKSRKKLAPKLGPRKPPPKNDGKKADSPSMKNKQNDVAAKRPPAEPNSKPPGKNEGIPRKAITRERDESPHQAHDREHKVPQSLIDKVAKTNDMRLHQTPNVYAYNRRRKGQDVIKKRG